MICQLGDCSHENFFSVVLALYCSLGQAGNKLIKTTELCSETTYNAQCYALFNLYLVIVVK